MEIETTIPKRAFGEKESGHYLGISVQLLRKFRRDGGGPRFVRIGKRVLYDVNDLNVFWEEQKQA